MKEGEAKVRRIKAATIRMEVDSRQPKFQSKRNKSYLHRRDKHQCTDEGGLGNPVPILHVEDDEYDG